MSVLIERSTNVLSSLYFVGRNFAFCTNLLYVKDLVQTVAKIRRLTDYFRYQLN